MDSSRQRAKLPWRSHGGLPKPPLARGVNRKGYQICRDFRQDGELEGEEGEMSDLVLARAAESDILVDDISNNALCARFLWVGVPGRSKRPSTREQAYELFNPYTLS